VIIYSSTFTETEHAMGVKCKSCGAQSNAVNQLSFVCEFCGTKNVDDQYLQNLAVQKATSEANSKSFQLGLISIQGNDIAAAEKQFEAAVSEDSNNPDAWVYLAYCKAALVKPSNYEKNIGVARQAIQKAKSLTNSSEEVDSGVVLVGGKFLQASVSASAYYLDTAMKKFLAYGENASARKMAVQEATLGLGILRDAIHMAEANFELVAVAGVYAYSKSFELINSIGHDQVLADFMEEFGKILVQVNQQRPELIQRELEKCDPKVIKSIKAVLPKPKAAAPATPVIVGNSDEPKDNGPLIKKVMMGVGALVFIIILMSMFGGSDKDNAPPKAPLVSQTIAPTVATAPAETSTPAPATEANASIEKSVKDQVKLEDVVAPAEAKPILSAMLKQATSSFQLAELKNQLESLPKPQLGDRKTARKMNDQALVLFKAGQFDEASEIFRQALAADLSDVEIKNNYVFSMTKAGKLGPAETLAGELLMNNPGRSSAWANLAEIYSLQGKNEESARALVIAFQFSSNKDKTLNFLREKLDDDGSILKIPATKAIELIEKL
jgi:Tfp pilus assembly protein PilF